MAELKQKEFGVKTQFQTITPQKSPDFRADNIKSGLQLASGLLKAEAAEEGREAAKTLSGTDLSLADVNRNVDIFEESMANNVTDAQVASGGTVTARQIAEIKDATLNQVNLSSRGLQEAINRGVVSHLEASARANVSLQRASNSLVGSLFQDDFRNAFSKVTGNPAGSPALTLTKSPAEVQQEANNKAIVEANASRTKQVQMQAAKDKSTFEQAEFKIIALENKQAEVVKMDALDKENLRSDEEKLRGAGTQFSTAIAPLMDDITAAFTSGRGLDPNEAVSLNQRIKVTADQIVNSHVSKGMGSKAQKALKEQATAWAKDQQQYVDDISLGKVSKELQDIIATGAQNLLATEMPLVYAMAKLGSPQLAQSLALMEPKTRREHVRRLGFNVESMLSLTDEFLKLKNVVDPQVKTHPKDAGVLAPTMSMNGGDANKKILDEYEASGGNLSDLATEWKASPEMSLMTIADSLSGQIESGDKNSVRIGVDILNMSRDKYFRLIEDYDVPKDYQYTIEQNPGKRFPDISFPAGLPDGEQQIIRQMYRAIDATPSLWREEFGSSQEAFTAVMNDGHEFTTEKITKPILKGEGVAEAIAEFGATEASRIRKREGIELTEDRPAQEQLDIIVQGLSSGKLKTTPDVLESITKLTGQLKAEAEAERVKNVPITVDRSPLQGVTPKGKGQPPQVELSDDIISGVLKFEGGFQDNPKDKGNFDSQGNLIGTNKGITPSSYKAAFGKEPTADELKNLTDEEVTQIYQKNFWEPNRIGEMPPEVQEIAMNMFVMTSPRNATKALQRAAGAKEDGVIGDQTLKALRGTTPEEIWEEYQTYLKSLKAWKDFGKGWTNRYEEILGGNE